MISLPEEYIVSKFFLYTYSPKHNRYNNTYQGGCPICKEGSSQGRKRRCYYIPKNNNIFCHNCGWSGVPLRWIKEVSGCSTNDIILELKDENFNAQDEIVIEDDIVFQKKKDETLTRDTITLFDINQLQYHKDNKVVQACSVLITQRRLNSAINKPNSLYVSLVDNVHKNRLIIPFFNENQYIEFYQTRTVLESDKNVRPKYISKIGAEKTLFNIDKITGDYNDVFVFEGPLNAFFTRNSVAVAGITEKGDSMFTVRQQQQADSVLKWLNRIWVLDSQWIDSASLKKTETLLKIGENVFIWPEKYGKKFKDFNDICIKCKIDEISHTFIKENTFEGIKGILKLSKIKAER